MKIGKDAVKECNERGRKEEENEWREMKIVKVVVNEDYVEQGERRILKGLGRR